MKAWNLFFCMLLAFALAMSLAIVACGDDDDDDDDTTTDDDDDITDDDDDDDDDECGPEELCANAVSCGYFTEVSECTPWYDNAANCADMPGYIDCNCDCLDTDPTCGPWITCGEDCFNTLCI